MLNSNHAKKELKAFRLRESRKKGIKPYYIYNDNQLKHLISAMPKNKEELRAVKGFGDAKTEKYDAEILKMIDKYIKAKK